MAVRTELAKSVKAHQAATAIHNLAPDSDGTNTPVIEGTGNDRGDGRKAIKKLIFLS